MTEQTVEIRFKGNRRVWHVWPEDRTPLRINEAVVVQAERGLDFGWVNRLEAVASCDGCTSCSTDDAPAAAESAPISEALPETGSAPTAETTETAPQPTAATTSPSTSAHPAIVRRATNKDIKQHQDLRRSEEDVRRHIMARVLFHKVQMRITDTEWQWDSNRLTIYFTSDRRVDFRDLVRELASHFRARIDLRQIGVREEAARLGGVGRCGREYCCSTWLTEPGPVNLALAKDQRLSLNPSQISGGCGRLLCCLKYEHEFYLDSRKRFPKEGKTVRTRVGPEKVIAVDIFRERVYLRGEETPGRVIPLIQYREELESGVPLTGAVAPPEPAATPRPPRPNRRPPRTR